jgi:hypothetical protein
VDFAPWRCGCRDDMMLLMRVRREARREGGGREKVINGNLQVDTVVLSCNNL